MNNELKQENSTIKMMGEHLAVPLTEEETRQVAGGRWFSTWAPSDGAIDAKWYE
jgi:hypothetical protein